MEFMLEASWRWVQAVCTLIRISDCKSFFLLPNVKFQKDIFRLIQNKILLPYAYGHGKGQTIKLSGGVVFPIARSKFSH